MLSKASERLEKHGESIKFVPESEHHANLLDIITGRISLKEVGFATFLLLYIKLLVFCPTIENERSHEGFRKCVGKDRWRILEDGDNTVEKSG